MLVIVFLFPLCIRMVAKPYFQDYFFGIIDMLLQTNPRMDIYLDGAYIGNTLIRKGDEDGN